MNYLSLCLFLLLGLPAWSQMPMSAKLGKHDGLPELSIGQKLPIKNGFTEISRENSKAHFFESEYFETKIYEVQPAAVHYTEVNGLKVDRIEVLAYESEDETGAGDGFMVSEIVVLLNLPASDEILSAFMEAFTEAYAPELDVMGFTEEMVPLLQWHSTNDCGAMMSLPMLFSLDEYAESGMRQVEIRFFSSCGG